MQNDVAKTSDTRKAAHHVDAQAERSAETKLKLAKYLRRLDAEYSDVTAQRPAA